jgi:uncharacterized membrane protein
MVVPMTPAVRDILIDARKQVHAAIADRACITDTNALFVLDQLIAADARAAVKALDQEETVAALSDDTPNPYEEAERKAIEEKLAKLEKQIEQDTKIINGLRDELKKRGQG